MAAATQTSGSIGRHGQWPGLIAPTTIDPLTRRDGAVEGLTAALTAGRAALALELLDERALLCLVHGAPAPDLAKGATTPETDTADGAAIADAG